MECSVIIPAFNRVDLTAQCLRSLISHTRDVDYEVILVDNASSDATPQLCERVSGEFTVIRNDENRGFAAACNQGAAAATSDRLLFLNTDTEPFPGWLRPSLDLLDTAPDVGMVGMRLLFPDHRIQHAGVVLVRREQYPHIGPRHLPYKVAADDPSALARREVSVVTAASVLMRRDAFESVGGFDEGYWNGYEDVDLCLAMRAAGWRIMYEPDSVVLHHESSSGPERFTGEARNIDRLEQKWADSIVFDYVAHGSDLVSNPHGFPLPVEVA